VVDVIHELRGERDRHALDTHEAPPMSMIILRIILDRRRGGSGDEVTARFVDAPSRPRALLVLGHGAGGNRSTESIVLLQDALAEKGVRSLAFNFPYAEAGRRRPDSMPRLEQAYAAALGHARSLLARGELLLTGGRSMGGRVATHLAAAGSAQDGLVLLGYPLHPAGRPASLRVAHLPSVRAPMLFISGTKDKLAERGLLASAVAGLGDRARLHWIEGADHGLDLPKRARKDRRVVAEEVGQVIVEWMTNQLEEGL
jgi:predicted alpha/beta-hydrolase family hydrolase